MTSLPDRFPAEWPAEVTVVTPTRRLAHHLRARHEAACLERGLVAWRTPDAVTWSELLRRHFGVDRARGATRARWLETGQALMAWEQIVRQDPELADVLAPTGMAARAQRSWALMHEYQIARDALATDASPEVRAFGRWADAYERWLRLGGWMDPAEAAASVGPGEPGAVLRLVGFDRLTPAQQAAIERFAAAGVDLRIEAFIAPLAGAQPALSVRNDFDDEIEGAARWAAARLVREPSARLAIVVPGLSAHRARVRRTLDRVLAPAAAATGGPPPESTAYELAAARPLVERPVVAAALAWLDAAARDGGLALRRPRPHLALSGRREIHRFSSSGLPIWRNIVAMSR